MLAYSHVVLMDELQKIVSNKSQSKFAKNDIVHIVRCEKKKDRGSFFHKFLLGNLRSRLNKKKQSIRIYDPSNKFSNVPEQET